MASDNQEGFSQTQVCCHSQSELAQSKLGRTVEFPVARPAADSDDDFVDPLGASGISAGQGECAVTTIRSFGSLLSPMPVSNASY
jgi:hypothetical protein